MLSFFPVAFPHDLTRQYCSNYIQIYHAMFFLNIRMFDWSTITRLISNCSHVLSCFGYSGSHPDIKISKFTGVSFKYKSSTNVRLFINCDLIPFRNDLQMPITLIFYFSRFSDKLSQKISPYFLYAH